MRASLLLLALAACSIPSSDFHASLDSGAAGGGDDEPGLRPEIKLSTGALGVTEGTTGTFDVSLTADPGTTVTVSLTDDNPDALPIDPTSITFDSASYATPVHVRVNPPVDTNAVSETATVTATIDGTPTSASLTLTATDATVITALGWPAPPAFTGAVTMSQGQLIAYKVTTTATSMLDLLGVFVPTASGDYRMALYTDNSGTPSSLLSTTTFPRRALANGANIADLTDQQLAAGSYWIVLRVGQTTTLSAGEPTQTGVRCTRQINIVNLDDAWPTNFGTADCSTLNLFNVWIQTYHQ